MKAAVYYETGAPEVFRYEEVPDPPLHPRGVLVDVKAIGIEGGDVLNRAGGEMPRRPHVVGYNCAGVVSEVGAEVRDRSPGDRVTALMPNGSHASLASVPAAQTWLIPDSVSFEQAACVPVSFGTAHDCVHEFGRLRAGESVLVQAGTSGVGIACVQIAKRGGASVIATSSSDEKLERLRAYGLDHGVNYASGDFVARVRELTGGKGANLIVDSVGGRTLEGSLQCAAYRGRVITVGNVSREGKRIDVSPLAGGANASLTGVFFGLELVLAPVRVRKLLDDLLADIAKGDLRVAIDRRYPLSEAAAAHRYIESRAAFGRVVLMP